MRISAKIDYACRALTELALHWPDTTPLQIREIAQKQKIPMKFLVHILIQLKQLGFVESSRGKSGGYVLIQSPQKIKLSTIIKNFGGLGYSAVDEKIRSDKHVMDVIWKDIDKSMIQMMEKITFENICDLTRSKDKAINFEI